MDRRYFAGWQVLNSNEFGVPQARRRGFVLAVREDVARAVGIRTDEDIVHLYPVPTNPGLTVRHAFEGLQQAAEDIWPWQRTAMTTSLGTAIPRLPKNPMRLTRIQHVSPGDLSKFTLTRCSWNLPAPTLVVAGQQPNGMTGTIHPDQDRKFTIPELKRLFALPDDYQLTGTLSQAAERICRMVPPLMTKAIGDRLYHRVLKPYYEAINGQR